MAVLYPPDLLFAFLEFPPAVAISQWLHPGAGGGRGCTPCAAGGGARPPGGADRRPGLRRRGLPSGPTWGHLSRVHASAWLPWVALCTLRLARSLGEAERAEGPAPGPGPGYAVARRRGAVVALQLTAGHTQEAYYSLLAVGLLGAGYTAFPPARAPVRWAHPLAVGAVALNGALLARAQLLPALELSRSSYRQGASPSRRPPAWPWSGPTSWSRSCLPSGRCPARR